MVARIRRQISSWPASACACVAYRVHSISGPRVSSTFSLSTPNTMVSKISGGPSKVKLWSSPSHTVETQYGPIWVWATRL